MEACSEGGCLSVSLLELLAFNLTFVFVASMLVLVEVRCARTNTLTCPLTPP